MSTLQEVRTALQQLELLIRKTGERNATTQFAPILFDLSLVGIKTLSDTIKNYDLAYVQGYTNGHREKAEKIERGLDDLQNRPPPADSGYGGLTDISTAFKSARADLAAFDAMQTSPGLHIVNTNTGGVLKSGQQIAVESAVADAIKANASVGRTALMSDNPTMYQMGLALFCYTQGSAKGLAAWRQYGMRKNGSVHTDTLHREWLQFLRTCGDPIREPTQFEMDLLKSTFPNLGNKVPMTAGKPL